MLLPDSMESDIGLGLIIDKKQSIQKPYPRGEPIGGSNAIQQM
jgi:hypothetical protein